MVECPYCGQPAVLEDSKVIYGRSYGNIWLCRCQPKWSYVGCRKGSEKPLGTLADFETRKWRKLAHKMFDPHWRSGKMTRSEAYAWLAKVLELTKDECHIAKSTAAQCERIVTVCSKR